MLVTDHPTTAVRGAKLDELSWLTGHWLGRRGEDHVEEVWSDALGGTMMGMFRWVRATGPFFYELTLLEPVDDTVLFRIKHFHPGLIGWEEMDRCVTFLLVALGPGEAVFHQQGVDDPPWMVYRLAADGTLESWFQRAGGAEVEDKNIFRYRRTTP